jgi:hypothetical protein
MCEEGEGEGFGYKVLGFSVSKASGIRYKRACGSGGVGGAE